MALASTPLHMGLRLNAILWRCFTQLCLNRLHFLAKLFINCQNYSNFHLHSASTYWCYFVYSIIYHRMLMASLLYCTKNKLKKSASSMGFCLTRRLASSCNFNSLILVNLIKCLCSKEISIWLHFIGRIKLRTRINATCVRTLTTCSYNYGLVPYIFDLGVTKIILCLV